MAVCIFRSLERSLIYKEGSINRCGKPTVRWTLVEMVWRLMIWQPHYGPAADC